MSSLCIDGLMFAFGLEDASIIPFAGACELPVWDLILACISRSFLEPFLPIDGCAAPGVLL